MDELITKLSIMGVIFRNGSYLTHSGDRNPTRAQTALVNDGLAGWGGNALYLNERGMLWADGIFGSWGDPVI